MKVGAVSFGNNPNRRPLSHDEMQKRALQEVMRHWKETGDYAPARIDYLKDGRAKITYLTESAENFQKINQSQVILQKIGKFIKNIFKK